MAKVSRSFGAIRRSSSGTDTTGDYIVNRRDLLVPQDTREQKVSLFTPYGCVEKSQEALDFSAEASAVFSAGRGLWNYYHAHVNAPAMMTSGNISKDDGKTA